MSGDQLYLAFMVRLWTQHHDGELLWRASIEDAHTGARCAFAEVEDLIHFLRITMDRPAACGLRESRMQPDDDAGFDQF